MSQLHVLEYEELLRALKDIGFTPKVFYEASVGTNNIKRHPVAIVWQTDIGRKHHPRYTGQSTGRKRSGAKG